MEGRAADGRPGVLRFAERRAADGAIGVVPGDLQSAGRNSGSHVPHHGDESDEPAAAAAAAGADPAAVSVGIPGDEPQRAEAVDGGASGKYSRYYRCGYSAGVAGGAGASERRRGLCRSAATRGRTARRAGCSRTSAESSLCRRRFRCGPTGTRASHTSAVSVNEARYNDFVPMIYGTAWYQPAGGVRAQ